MIDIDKIIERYKEEAKLYENDIVVYSHVMGFIHVLEEIKEQQENKSGRRSVTINCVNADKFAEKCAKLKEEKEWAETVAQNRLEGNEILESAIDRLESKVEQLQKYEEAITNLNQFLSSNYDDPYHVVVAGEKVDDTAINAIKWLTNYCEGQEEEIDSLLKENKRLKNKNDKYEQIINGKDNLVNVLYNLLKEKGMETNEILEMLEEL